ncbi:hypothetical protein Avbf_12170 [Armadillidium vulgare]|nr:hypothetical protein Avbf_12170 [Armadillidium vulgare]
MPGKSASETVEIVRVCYGVEALTPILSGALVLISKYWNGFSTEFYQYCFSYLEKIFILVYNGSYKVKYQKAMKRVSEYGVTQIGLSLFRYCKTSNK